MQRSLLEVLKETANSSSDEGSIDENGNRRNRTGRAAAERKKRKMQLIREASEENLHPDLLE